MEPLRFFILAKQVTLYFRSAILSVPSPGKGSFLLLINYMFVRDCAMLSYLVEKIGNIAVSEIVREAGEEEERRGSGRRI